MFAMDCCLRVFAEVACGIWGDCLGAYRDGVLMFGGLLVVL